MKAGTQKLVLNMISTATMINLGRVKVTKWSDMQLSNSKHRSRCENINGRKFSKLPNMKHY
jgi:N-acetylmuramic acid 6-phosphate etherase